MEFNNNNNKGSPIHKEFLEKILGQRVETFSVSAGSNPGDNFTSTLFAINVLLTGKVEPLHLLLKTYPVLESRQKFLNETNLFIKEIKVYKEFIPALISFQDAHSNGGIIRPAVPPFVDGEAIDFTLETSVSCGPINPLENYLVMMDIRKTWKYQMVEKHVGLDFEHISLVLTELAKLHALGWALKERKRIRTLVDKYPYLVETCFTSRTNSSVDSMLVSNVQLVESIVSKHYEPGSRAGRGIEKLQNTGLMEVLSWFLSADGRVNEKSIREYLGDTMQVEYDGDDEPWMVSCHGDCWVNNMLFRYSDPENESRPTDLIFVDLQMYREGCPTTDLAYMFYSSTTYETRKKHLGTFLRLYYDQFLHFCKLLRVEPLRNFTYSNLLARFDRARLFGFLTSSLILPIILSEEATKDLDTLTVGQDTTEGADDDGEEKGPSKGFSDLFKSLTQNAGQDQKLEKRILEIVNDMVDSNVF